MQLLAQTQCVERARDLLGKTDRRSFERDQEVRGVR